LAQNSAPGSAKGNFGRMSSYAPQPPWPSTLLWLVYSVPPRRSSLSLCGSSGDFDRKQSSGEGRACLPHAAAWSWSAAVAVDPWLLVPSALTPHLASSLLPISPWCPPSLASSWGPAGLELVTGRRSIWGSARFTGLANSIWVRCLSWRRS
jgi:hypothetical protein